MFSILGRKLRALPTYAVGLGAIIGLSHYIGNRLYSKVWGNTSFVTRKLMRKLGWRGQEFLSFLQTAEEKCVAHGGTLNEAKTLTSLYNAVYYLHATSEVWCKSTKTPLTPSEASAHPVPNGTPGSFAAHGAASAR